MKYVSVVMAVLGLVGVAIGAVFIGVAQHENGYITSQLRQQGITLGLTQEQVAKGEVVDNAAEARLAATTLATHLASIAPNYSALMAQNPSGRFDPTNPADLTYGQGLTLENSMNMVVLGYGVDEAIMGTGAAVIVIGLGLATAGAIILRLVVKKEEATVKQRVTKNEMVEAGSAAS